MVLDSTNQWANQQQCMDFHCTITSWYSASFPRTEGILFYFIGEWEGKSSSFLFSSFLSYPWLVDVFMEGTLLEWSWIVRAETGPPFLSQKSSKLLPGLYLPLWNGESVTYVIEPSWMLFARQRVLRCAAWLWHCALYFNPDLLWFLAFGSSSGLFPAVLVFWPKIFPSLQSNENQD